MKRYSTVLVIRKMQFKNYNEGPPHPSEWPWLKRLTAPDADCGCNKLEPLCTADGVQNGKTTLDTLWQFLKKVRNSYYVTQ